MLGAFVFHTTLTEQTEQRICIKFCQKLSDLQAETIDKIKKALSDDAMRATN